jgi:tripartite motif-containing protein 71
MKRQIRKLLVFGIVFLLIGGACSPAPTPSPTPVPPTATPIPPTATVPPPTATTAAQPTALPVILVGKITGGPKPFGGPCAIAIDKQNNLYVLDAQLNAVLKFDSDGKFITQWGSQGNGNGQFDFQAGAYPYRPTILGDVDVDGENNVYVVVTAQNRIQKFDSTGKFITEWGSKGTGDGQFDGPDFVTTDGAGNIYVSDALNVRIEKFDGTGKFLAQWGGYGTGEGQFFSPAGLHFDGLGNLYVADPGNGRIQKFDPMGKFLLHWKTSYGTSANQGIVPVALTVDTQNRIYVSDPGGQRICEFDGSGKFLGTWGSRGLGDLQFQTPTGLALDDQGNIYVSDFDLKVVKKFRQP